MYDIIMHRFFYHRNYQIFYLPAPIKFLFLVIALPFETILIPLMLASSHIRHHKYVDTNKDPFNPEVVSMKDVVMMLNKPMTDEDIICLDSLFDKIKRDRVFNFWTFNKYFEVFFHALVAGVLFYISPIVFAAIYAVPKFISMFYSVYVLSAIHNNNDHWFQYRNFESKKTGIANNDYMMFILFGSSAMHNNHHELGNDMDCGVKWFEFDLVGRLIKKLLPNVGRK